MQSQRLPLHYRHPEKNLNFLAGADESVQQSVYLQFHPGFSFKGEGSNRKEFSPGPDWQFSGTGQPTGAGRDSGLEEIELKVIRASGVGAGKPGQSFIPGGLQV
jgi:hypothetical protein